MKNVSIKNIPLTALLAVVLVWGCKKDKTPPTVPTVETATITNTTASGATCGGSIVSDGGAMITASGIVWSKTNANPTTSDSIVSGGSSNTTGSFTIDLTGLDFGTKYYIRAFATNSAGTGYGGVMTLNTTDDTAKVRFVYNGDTVVYGVITSSVTGRKWMDRNLGAQEAANAADDYKAYGDLFQWGRPADGHQLINWTSAAAGTPLNDTTHELSSTEVPGHSKYIIFTDFQSYQQEGWYLPFLMNPSVQTLGRWYDNPQGPCPQGWHVPTSAEWSSETEITDTGTAYANLKLTAAGNRFGDDYSAPNYFKNTGKWGYYWTSDFNYARIESDYFKATYGDWDVTGKSVRCIKDL